MNPSALSLHGIPALLYGAPAQRVFLHVHGKFGCKEEAERFAEIACPMGWQVVSLDLPGHGERKGLPEPFTPWQVIPELQRVYDWMRPRWKRHALYATSMGCWFSMPSPSPPITSRLLRR